MPGKLFIIEGIDGSGKETQTKMLYNRLKKEEFNIKKVEFPDYKSDSSILVKMYLNGDFGDNPNDVDAYVSSTFYAVDRYASYKTKWEEFYKNNGIIIADRYTSSNMIHQASKIKDHEERNEFLKWLDNLEYGIYKLPRPTAVIFLNMPAKYGLKLIKDRDNKITGEKTKDIHESDIDYLKNAYKTALNVAKEYNWIIIDCIKDNKILSKAEIHNKVYSEIQNYNLGG